MPNFYGISMTCRTCWQNLPLRPSRPRTFSRLIEKTLSFTSYIVNNSSKEFFVLFRGHHLQLLDLHIPQKCLQHLRDSQKIQNYICHLPSTLYLFSIFISGFLNEQPPSSISKDCMKERSVGIPFFFHLILAFVLGGLSCYFRNLVNSTLALYKFMLFSWLLPTIAASSSFLIRLLIFLPPHIYHQKLPQTTN